MGKPMNVISILTSKQTAGKSLIYDEMVARLSSNDICPNEPMPDRLNATIDLEHVLKINVGLSTTNQNNSAQARKR